MIIRNNSFGKSLIVERESLSYLAIYFYFIYSLLRTIHNNFGILSNIFSYIFIAVAYILLFVCIINNRSKALLKSFCLLFVTFVVVLISYYLHPENGEILSKAFALQYGISIVPFVCVIDREKTINKVIISYAVISFISSVSSLMLYFINGGYWVTTYGDSTYHLSYNMSMGYEALIAGLVFYWIYKESRSKWYLICSIISIIVSLLWGARGCLICYALYFLLFVLVKHNSRKKIAFLLSIGIVFVFIYFIGFDLLILLFSNILMKIGINSRTLSSLSSIVNADSGRFEIWSVLLKKLYEKPFFGYGVFGDQYLLSNYSNQVTLYAHNIIIEMCVSFGVPIGIGLLVYLTVNLRKAIIYSRGNRMLDFFLCFVAYNIGNLLVSNTFWYSTSFWFMIGLTIYIIQNRNNMLNSNEFEKSHEEQEH